MRLLFFISDIEWTARARVFVTAATGLGMRTHEVAVACPPGPIIDHLDTRVIDIVRIDPEAMTAVGAFDVRRVARERSIDVAFVHTAREQAMVGTGLRFAGGGAVLRRAPAFGALDEAPGLFSSRTAPTGILVAGEAQARTLSADRGVAVSVVPLGVDPTPYDQLAPSERGPLGFSDQATLMACPYAPGGKLQLLDVLRTVAALAPHHPTLRVIVFGPGAANDELRLYASALGVSRLVLFLSPRTVSERAIMKACDIVWIAAADDAAALGCLDGMALRLPVIAARSPVSEHFIDDGVTGTLVPDGEVASLAAAVAPVVGRRDVRTRYGTAGRQRVQREFSEQAMIDGFERAATAAVPASDRIAQ